MFKFLELVLFLDHYLHLFLFLLMGRILLFPLFCQFFIVVGSQVSNFFHKLFVCFDYLFGNVELELRNHIFPKRMNVFVQPVLFRNVEGFVEKERSWAEILELLWSDPEFLTVFKLFRNVVPGFDCFGKLLDELEDNWTFLTGFMEVLPKILAFLSEFCFLFLRPFAQSKLTVVPDQDIGEAFVVNLFLHVQSGQLPFFWFSLNSFSDWKSPRLSCCRTDLEIWFIDCFCKLLCFFIHLGEVW